MSDIFHEVEEDLRRDKMDELWKKYGPWLMVTGGAFIIVVAGFLWFSDFQQKQREARSDEYLAAIDLVGAGNVEAGMTALDAIIAKGNSGYAALALLAKGAQLTDEGDRAGAIAAYDALATSSLGDEMLRDVALVKAGWLAAEVEDFETVQAMMANVVSGQSVWAPAAREVVAFSAFRTGDLETARSLLGELMTDAATPQGMRARSRELLGIVLSQIGPVEASHEGHDHSDQELDAEAETSDEVAGDAVEEPTPDTPSDNGPSNDTPSDDGQ